MRVSRELSLQAGWRREWDLDPTFSEFVVIKLLGRARLASNRCAESTHESSSVGRVVSLAQVSATGSNFGVLGSSQCASASPLGPSSDVDPTRLAQENARSTLV